MSDTDQVFTQATHDLIALYRSIERKALALPLLSLRPALIGFWCYLEFLFFLIIPDPSPGVEPGIHTPGCGVWMAGSTLRRRLPRRLRPAMTLGAAMSYSLGESV